MRFPELKSFVVIFVIFGSACERSADGDSGLFDKTDFEGRLLETWGKRYERDTILNFREFYYYNDRQLVSSSRMFLLEDDNTECVIVDSLDYIEKRYEYDALGRLLTKTRFDPEWSNDGTYIRHKLTYKYNYTPQKPKRPDSLTNI